MPPIAVLFDFDGVIADTENTHIAAWQRTLTRMGWELAEEIAVRAAEVDDRAFLNELFERRSIEGGDLDGWLKLKQDLTEAMLTDQPQVYPGVADLVHTLRSKGLRLGIVTTTGQRNVEIVLAKAKLSEAFEVIIAKEDVKSAKPAPEGYKLALKRLGIKPAEALVIEDSATGVEAAKGAEIRVLAVGHRRVNGDWSGGQFLLNFIDLPASLKAIGV